MTMFRSHAVAILAMFLFAAGCGQKKEKDQKTAEAVKVTITEIASSRQQLVLAYSGSIEADNKVSIGFNVAGRVTAVSVQEGQRVSAGQLLASIEQNTYQNNYDIAVAALEQAQDNFDRLDQLYRKGSLPERDYIAVKVGLVQAKANKETAAKNLHDTKLYASFSGIITQKQTEAGATAAPGVPAFTIVKTDKVYAVASITENEISTLKTGADAQIFIPSIGRKITCKVSIINPQGDNLSKTYTVKLRLDNHGGELLPGMIADILINTGKVQDALVIPSQAIVRDPDNINYVFVAKAGNKALKKRVGISKMTGTNDVVVTEGLQAGDKLIISGQTNLEDGTPVKF